MCERIFINMLPNFRLQLNVLIISTDFNEISVTISKGTCLEMRANLRI